MRWAPLAAFGLFLGLGIAWLGQDPAVRVDSHQPGSALRTGPEGLSLARGYLEKRGVRVSLLSLPLSQAALPADAVLLRIDPAADVERDRRRHSGREAEPEDPDGGDGGADAGDGGPADAGRTAPAATPGGAAQDAGPAADAGASAAAGPRPDGGARASRVEPAPQQDELTAAEDAFVRAGGRLVLAMRGAALGKPAADAGASDGGEASAPGATAGAGEEAGGQSREEDADADGDDDGAEDEAADDDGAAEASAAPDADLRKVLPLLPGVHALAPAVPRALGPLSLLSAAPVFEHGEAPSIAVEQRGRGEVWLLAEPELFYNRALGKADHLALLEALCAGGRPVVFDEHLHGARTETGVFSLLRRWGLGPALLFGLLALGAAWLRAAVTVGPAQDPWRDPRSESVELVDSMAALYERALSPEEALRLYRSQLVHELALRKGIGEKRAEALLPDYAPSFDPKGHFATQLAILVKAFQRSRHEHRRRS